MEGGSEGGREEGRGERLAGREEGRKRGEGREGKGGGNVKGGILRRELASIQYIHKPSHNALLALETLVLQMRNSEHV